MNVKKKITLIGLLSTTRRLNAFTCGERENGCTSIKGIEAAGFANFPY
jgi:hypothetical protein